MDYKIIVNKRALKEIKEAINYYKSKSYLAPIKFILNLEKTYSSLTKYPYYRIRYKNVRSIKVIKFPYSLFYILHEETSLIQILSCFHNKLDSNKFPEL